ncbi:hypothetical protein B0J13DRAFT_584544 [Dactylonectria estremocensis]|uniref:Uncharacterized protein n=1 Tax=Dactylonectria estremocensis TaxID=1079267 RepID=A0A9P9J3A3_9HYPO|nr:hypothetical protein B0J13DRAFT_584544 [Dactylonectria estremocensis]
MVLNYNAGVIHAQGAFTTEIHIEARVFLQDVWNDQYHGSQIMGKRPGMYLKYLPCRFHDVSGDVLTGGSYLFRTLEEANDYKRWTSNDLEVGEPKTTFWKQPLFKSVNLWAWSVIGAHNFTPVDNHAIGRFQRWKYDIKGVESILQQHYPVLKDAAESRGRLQFHRDVFPEALNAELILDRTSPYLAVWLPLLESNQAVEVKSPAFPTLSKSPEKD